MRHRPPPLVAEVDVGRPLPRWIEAATRGRIRILVRFNDRPLGTVTLTTKGPKIHRRVLARAIETQVGDDVVEAVVLNGLATPGQRSLDLSALLGLPEAPVPVVPDQLTAIVCTTGSTPQQVDRCVAALLAGTVPPAEVLVIERGAVAPQRRADPPRDGTVAGRRVRRIPASGVDLERARSIGVESARTPLVAFVDETVSVDAGWARAMCRAFVDCPHAMAVVGAIVPETVQTEPACLLEGARERMAWRDPFEFRWFRLRSDETMPREWLNALQFGSASNMAFRRDALVAGGGFAAVAGGAATETSQHLDLWLRLLDAGHGIVREPAASGRIAAPSSLEQVAREIHAEAAGISAALMAAVARRPRRAFGTMLVGQWFLRTALVDLVGERGTGRTIAWARLRGHLGGTWRGLGRALRDLARPKSRRSVTASAGAGVVTPIEVSIPAPAEPDRPCAAAPPATEVPPVVDLIALWHGALLGRVSVVTGGRSVGPRLVHRLLVDSHWESLSSRHLGLLPEAPDYDGFTWRHRAEAAREAAHRRLRDHLLPAPPPQAGTRRTAEGRNGTEECVSIVIPTRDRPDNLRECLLGVLAQESSRRTEVVVVDNNPGSGLTPEVLREFPTVRRVEEPRRGAAYARNRGLLAARGTLIVCIDDDVTVPDGWLERLLAPLDDPSVTIVTGNIIPRSLGSRTERLTEECCSLSAGLAPFTVDGSWFDTCPTAVQGWDFGTTANLAVRSRVFSDPAVGMFAESLGPGTPVGAGEDPYFLYRALRAGHTLRYLPDVWVWHKHRTSPAGLRRQVYAYAKSAVAYHLMALHRDGDRRSRQSLYGGLQRHYLRRAAAVVRGDGPLPWWIVATELAGHAAGAFAFVASVARRRSLARDPRYPATPEALPHRRRDDADQVAPWALSPVAPPPPAVDAGAGASVPAEVDVSRPPRRGRLPHFLVIGTQKGGTTALDNNLRKHPGIELVPHFRLQSDHWNNTKETHFFSGWGEANGIASIDEYRDLFNDNGLLQGEVCPSYESPTALESIANAIPDVRLILICREPTSRLASAWNHLQQERSRRKDFRGWHGWNPALPFETNFHAEIGDPDLHGLVRMGIYRDIIENVWRLFGRDRFLVLFSEDYRRDPQRTYDRIFAFLGVRSCPIRHRDAHVRSYQAGLTSEERKMADDFYRPHNERLYDLLGYRISSWAASAGGDPDG